MNELVFIIDNNGEDDYNILSCTYVDFDSYSKFKEYTEISLPKADLIELFKKVNNNNFYMNHVTEETIAVDKDSDRKGTKITFYDLDVDEMDDLVQRSKKYQEKLKLKKYQEVNNTIPNDIPKKVTRKNNFERTIAIVSTLMMIALTVLGISKAVNEPKEKIDDNVKVINIIDENTRVEKKPDVIYYPSESKEIEVTPTPTAFVEEDKIDGVIRVDTENDVDCFKFFIADAYYRDAITKTALEFGLDPNLVIAIATHERGIHSEITDTGGAIGLFQIQVRGDWNWEGKEIRAYDFNVGDYVTETITEESASDVFQNIKLGCMMIQNALVARHYNIPLGVTEYNYGGPYLDKVLEKCSSETGFTIQELNDCDNLEWLKYRSIVSGGDPIYLENVFKYIEDGTVLTFKTPNGEVLNYKYENLSLKNNFNRK